MTDRKPDEERGPPPYSPGQDNLPAYHELPEKKVRAPQATEKL
jgi:hypothetical protein